MDTNRNSIQGEITALKMLLADSDYQSNKLIESLVAAMRDASAVNFIQKFLSWLSAAVQEYGEIVQKRAKWREQINALEARLAAMDETGEEGLM